MTGRHIVAKVYSDNPKSWAQALVACLGVDKGVSAVLEEGFMTGSWRVVADDGKVVLVFPKPSAEAVQDVVSTNWPR
jgi:hypothetical protein